MVASILDQLPTLSKYDPGASGEGSLDPLGLGTVADRIADRLVPGIRARMSQPRFVTLTAVGAQACQSLVGVTSSDGKTTFDIAFEWLVVESLVRYPQAGRAAGVPGSQKAQRARAVGERLSAGNYLAGPRVFGFTGVYRPFSLDGDVIDARGLPGRNAERLIAAWERDRGLDGFQLGISGSPGGNLKRDIENTVRDSLAKGQASAPPTGRLIREIGEHLAPNEAGGTERNELRRLVTGETHAIRHELTQLMLANMPQGEYWPTQQELAVSLLEAARSEDTRVALRAAIAYETCATSIEYAFRRLLQYGTALGDRFSPTQGKDVQEIAELAPRLGDLVSRAVDATAELEAGLGIDAGFVFSDFAQILTPADLVEALVVRHERVQVAKGKRMWIDPMGPEWVIRPAYRLESISLDDEIWAHPMRIGTLLGFLVRTA